MYLKHGLVALLTFGPVSAVSAAPATEEGAEKLQAAFQTYLGTIEGMVSVTPKGENYELVVDAAPGLALLPTDDKLSVTLTPLIYQLTDNGDGSWGVSSDQVVNWSVNIPEQYEQTGSARLVSTGTWMEALAAFSENNSVATDYVIDTVEYGRRYVPPASNDPDAESSFEVRVASRSHQTYDKAESVLTGGTGTRDALDYTMTFSATGLTSTMDYSSMYSDEAFHVEVTSPGYEGKANVTGLRNDGMMALLAWFVAHPSEEQIVGSQNDLRDKISASLPLWDDVSGDMVMHDLKIAAPMFAVEIAEIKGAIKMAGVATEGLFQETVSLSGLSVSSEEMPAWITPLIPQEMSFDFMMSDFNLAAPAKMIIESFDLAADDPMAALDGQKLQAAFLGNDTFALTFAPGYIKGDGYQLDFKGDMAISFEDTPTGTGEVSATGLDKIEAALQAAPPEETAEALMGLRMARAMAKPGDNDAAVWAIEMTADKGLSVNGQALGGAPAQ